MRVSNILESKKNFKKQFNNDCNGTFTVQIRPENHDIRVATTDRFMTIRELYIPMEFETWETKKVTLSSIDRRDVLWDFIWSKDGFWVELYKDTYKDIISQSKHFGTIYTMAEVIFNTKRKRYIYKDWECSSINVIS